MDAFATDQQRTFAEAYVLGCGNATQAAIDAGYSPASARQTASRLLHTPHVQDAIRRAQAHALKGRLASKALGVLEKILDDEKAPAGVRVDAAKTVLDRAGFAAARVPEDPYDDGPPLATMTLDQLNALVAELERAHAMVTSIPGDVVRLGRRTNPGEQLPVPTSP